MSAEPGRRYCGREISTADLAHIRELLQIKPVLSRVALSRRVCQDLGWLNSLSLSPKRGIWDLGIPTCTQNFPGVLLPRFIGALKA
jgi:hypothetical protein